MMPRSLADLFGRMSESLRQRIQSEKHDKDVLRAGVKAISSAVAESENTPQDEMILECAPTAFRTTYPRATPWSGEDLHFLLNKMAAVIKTAAAGKPVAAYDLEEAKAFCISMREQLAHKANGY